MQAINTPKFKLFLSFSVYFQPKPAKDPRKRRTNGYKTKGVQYMADGKGENNNNNSITNDATPSPADLATNIVNPKNDAGAIELEPKPADPTSFSTKPNGNNENERLQRIEDNPNAYAGVAVRQASLNTKSEEERKKRKERELDNFLYLSEALSEDINRQKQNMAEAAEDMKNAHIGIRGTLNRLEENIEQQEQQAEEIMAYVYQNASPEEKARLEEKYNILRSQNEETEKLRRKAQLANDGLVNAIDELAAGLNDPNTENSELDALLNNVETMREGYQIAAQHLQEGLAAQGRAAQEFIQEFKTVFPNDPQAEQIAADFENLMSDAELLGHELTGFEELSAESQQKLDQFAEKWEELRQLAETAPDQQRELLLSHMGIIEESYAELERFKENKKYFFDGAKEEVNSDIASLRKLHSENLRLTCEIQTKEAALASSQERVLENLETIKLAKESSQLRQETLQALSNSDAKDRSAFIHDNFGGAMTFHGMNVFNFFSKNPQTHVLSENGDVVFEESGIYYYYPDNNPEATPININLDKDSEEYAQLSDLEKLKMQVEVDRIEHMAWVQGRPLGNETRFGDQFKGLFEFGLMDSIKGGQNVSIAEANVAEQAQAIAEQLQAEEVQYARLQAEIAIKERQIKELEESIDTNRSRMQEQASEINSLFAQLKDDQEMGLLEQGEMLAITQEFNQKAFCPAPNFNNDMRGNALEGLEIDTRSIG
jgi:hypothetical protein